MAFNPNTMGMLGYACAYFEENIPIMRAFHLLDVCIYIYNAVHNLRVQVPDSYILPQKLYCNYYGPHPKYLNIGFLDP